MNQELKTGSFTLFSVVLFMSLLSAICGFVMGIDAQKSRIESAYHNISCSGYYRYSARSQMRLAYCRGEKIKAMLEANQ